MFFIQNFKCIFLSNPKFGEVCIQAGSRKLPLQILQGKVDENLSGKELFNSMLLADSNFGILFLLGGSLERVDRFFKWHGVTKMKIVKVQDCSIL